MHFHDDDMPTAMPGGSVSGPPASALHDHPLPPAFRVLAAAYGLLILLFGGLVLWTVHELEAQYAEQRTAILAEIDRRTQERRANEDQVQRQLQQQRDATRQALCAFLASDLEQTPRLIALELRFQCPPQEGEAQP